MPRVFIIVACILLTRIGGAQEGPVATFGTTVVLPSGFRGEVYYIPEWSQHLPRFNKLKPVGAIYTNQLNIPPRQFTEGFPGITDRNEWFAIDYTGRFWIEKPGKYTFALESDDGSKLYIDGKERIDNDGIHGTRAYASEVKLRGGIHSIRVSYFQGPRTTLALVLAVQGPGDDDYRIFSTTEFKPPSNPADWKYGTPDDLDNKAWEKMTSEQQLREKLRKISALFEGASTAGERSAAMAAIARVKASLAAFVKTEPAAEVQFTLPDRWQRRLFAALCRRYGLQPYRYKRQRYTTVMVRAPRTFIDRTLWPEYSLLKDALDAYLNEATERIIREEVDGDIAEAQERAG